jgi:hypothetical protein
MSALDKGIARALELGCPAQLAAVIREFVTTLCECLADQKVGVLLVGSASRGELSWHDSDDKVELFSDVEFLVGVEHRDRARHSDIDSRAKRIAQAADLGEFFHIDYTFIEWSQLPKLDTKFFVFESKECGIDLCRNELAPHLPATTPANLNYKELNEILVHRLCSIVHAIPQDFFSACVSADANQKLALNLAKNTLDITTWLHPYESSTLVAGFGNRLRTWQETQLKGLKISNFFVAEDIQYLQSCLALRNAPSTPVESRQMLHKTLDMYSRAIRYCKHMNGIAETTPVSKFSASVKLFDEYRLRSRVAQSASILRHARQTGFLRLFTNLFGVRRGLAVQICMNLISAAVDAARDEVSASRFLDRARKHLGRVIVVPVSDKYEFSTRWFDTLAVFSKHQQITQNF